MREILIPDFLPLPDVDITASKRGPLLAFAVERLEGHDHLLRASMLFLAGV